MRHEAASRISFGPPQLSGLTRQALDRAMIPVAHLAPRTRVDFGPTHPLRTVSPSRPTSPRRPRSRRRPSGPRAHAASNNSILPRPRPHHLSIDGPSDTPRDSWAHLGRVGWWSCACRCSAVGRDVGEGLMLPRASWPRALSHVPTTGRTVLEGGGGATFPR
jgi:hypothetical protein